MRSKQEFSIYGRKVASGKTIFYYHTYDEDGRRLCGHSTGKSTRTAAREFCMALFREQRLLPRDQGKIPTLDEFTKGWFDYDTCPYLMRRKGRRKISMGYAHAARNRLDLYILPFFGKVRLDRITDVEIDAWLTGFAGRGLGNNTANGAFNMLAIIMAEAFRKKIIKGNPCKLVDRLMVAEKNVEVLTLAEVKALFFDKDWTELWDNYDYYVINKLAACTGMRLGEIIGLRGEYVFDRYIHVCAQYGRFGYGDTKTHRSRDIPIPARMYEDLVPLIKKNKSGFLFSKDGGEKPIGRRAVPDALYKALDAIGIDRAERKRRNLTFHAWRHFFNTALLLANVSASKVKAVTGHVTQKMTEHYTHFVTKELPEIKEVQDGIFTHNG
jgi:integrase